MPVLSPQQIYEIAQRTFGDLGQATVDLMTKIALLESSGNTEAYNGAGLDRSTGLWQINTHPQANPQYASLNLTDPLLNAQVARQILMTQGPTAWSTYGKAQEAPVTNYYGPPKYPVPGGPPGAPSQPPPVAGQAVGPADFARAALLGEDQPLVGGIISSVAADGTVTIQQTVNGDVRTYTARRTPLGSFELSEVTPGRNGSPAVRYEIGDKGEVYTLGPNGVTQVGGPGTINVGTPASAQPQVIQRDDGSIWQFNPTSGQLSPLAGGLPNNTPIINERTGESFLIDRNTGQRISLGATNWPTINPERSFAEDQRQFDVSEGGTNWRFGTGLAEDARQFDIGEAGTNWRFGTGLQEDARQADNSLRSNDWQFGTGLAENARQTDNALNSTNWRFGEGLQEDARQFNVGETGVNDRARLSAATQGFQSVNQLAPQLGQLALQNAEFTAKTLQTPADYVARAYFSRGGESPLPVVNMADILNQLANNNTEFNNVLSGFNVNPLNNPQFLSPSQYGGYTNTVGLNQSPYGSYAAPGSPGYAAFGGVSGAPTGAAFGSYAVPGAPTGSLGGTSPRLPTTQPTQTPGLPVATSTQPAPTGFNSSPLSPQGNPYSPESQERWSSGVEDGSIVLANPDPSQYGSISQNAGDLFQPDSGGQDFRFEVDANGTLQAIPMALGGMTRAPMMMVGDHPSGRPTGNEEIVSNPTGAPISVIPNPNNQMGIPTSPPSFNQMPALPEQASDQAGMSRFGGVGAAWTQPRGFRLPAQADPRAGSNMPRFGEGTEDSGSYGRQGFAGLPPEMVMALLAQIQGGSGGYDDERVSVAGVDDRRGQPHPRDPLMPPRWMMPQSPQNRVPGRMQDQVLPPTMPRFALGTDFQMLQPGQENRYLDGGTVASSTEPMAVTSKTSEPTSFFQPPSLQMLQPGQETRSLSYGGAPASQLPASAAVLPAPNTTSIGMNFQAPQLPTQPQVTQQQLIDYARAYSPPAVSNVINGTMPESLRFGFPLPSPQLLNSLTPAERQALNTRMAVEFNTSLEDVEHAMKLRFTNARQRPRGRYAVGT